MEAKEFLKQFNRICKEHNDCYDCPLTSKGCNGSIIDNFDDNVDDLKKDLPSDDETVHDEVKDDYEIPNNFENFWD